MLLAATSVVSLIAAAIKPDFLAGRHGNLIPRLPFRP
jgi:hypothetical protein